MRKRIEKIFKTLRTFLILVIIIGTTVFFIPDYAKKAIRHTTPDIDDYKLFENRKVKAGEHQNWGLSQNYNQKQLPNDLLEKINKNQTTAFLVVQNGKLLYEKYWEGFDQDSYCNSFSVSKSIVSLLIGIALKEQKIKSIEDKVATYLPQWKENNENPQLTIKHLLTMSSGLDWNENMTPFSDLSKAYYGENLEKPTYNQDFEQEPGFLFEYKSGNTQLLAFILEEISGKTLSEYASEKLWKPIGAKNDALWSLDKKDGHEKAFCCFNSNARDFARIGQLVLNKGKWKKKQIVDKTFLKESLTPANFLSSTKGSVVDFYGYHWWMMNYKNRPVKYARGVKGQYIFIIPDLNAVVVRLGKERPQQKDGQIYLDSHMYLKAAFEVLQE